VACSALLHPSGLNSLVLEKVPAPQKWVRREEGARPLSLVGGAGSATGAVRIESRGHRAIAEAADDLHLAASK
jgi:hypothetical protein